MATAKLHNIAWLWAHDADQREMRQSTGMPTMARSGRFVLGTQSIRDEIEAVSAWARSSRQVTRRS